ncbi:MAG: GNAT family N-acetyltransferase [Candidatus Thorarchaeota archaeon]
MTLLINVCSLFMITYRRATIEDIDILIDLRVEFLYEALKVSKDVSNKELRNSLRDYFSKTMPQDEFIAWLAIHEDEIIATSGLSFYTVAPSFANISGRIGYILNMYTKPNWRRKGIGKTLFEKMLFEAKQKGISKLSLHATSDGRPLYEIFGFTTDEGMMAKKI